MTTDESTQILAKLEGLSTDLTNARVEIGSLSTMVGELKIDVRDLQCHQQNGIIEALKIRNEVDDRIAVGVDAKIALVESGITQGAQKVTTELRDEIANLKRLTYTLVGGFAALSISIGVVELLIR